MSQQINLSPQQLFSITELVLRDTQAWLEKKVDTIADSHPKRTRDAVGSILHARLLCNLRHHDILLEKAKTQPLPTPTPLDTRYIDTTRAGK